MTSFLSSLHEITEDQLELNHADPAFRKATANMIAAHAVCQKTLATLSAEEKKSLSFVVATYFGEVSSSLEFLSTLNETQVAKPILFQNSLHNSTLGFVSIQLGLTGPAFTLSADQQTDQAVAHTAETLLELTDHVLICYVDMIPDFLKRHYLIGFPQLSHQLGYARAMLLSKKRMDPQSIAFDRTQFSLENVISALKVSK